MAQSPLSQAIRQLESQVGATLFDRTTRRVELTPAGEAFLRDAERILDAVEAAQTRVRHIGDGQHRAAPGRVDRAGGVPAAAPAGADRRPRTAGPGAALPARPADPGAGARPRGGPDRSGGAAAPAAPAGAVRPAHRPGAARPRRSRRATAWPARSRSRSPSCATRTSSSTAPPSSVVDAVVTQACLAAGFLPRRTHEAARDLDHAHPGRRRPGRGAASRVGPGPAGRRRRGSCPSPTTSTSTSPSPGAPTTPPPPSPGCSRRLEANGFLAAGRGPRLHPQPRRVPLGGAR